MEKRQYERAQMNVLVLVTKDVITTSGYTGDMSSGIVLPEDIF